MGYIGASLPVANGGGGLETRGSQDRVIRDRREVIRDKSELR
jgi:hypothetical protein